MSTKEERNYQLQGSYTRYGDGKRIGYGSEYGPFKTRNFKTLQNAMRAAKKELKRNDCTPIFRTEKEYYGKGRNDWHFNCYAADGRKIPYDEPSDSWHTDGVRIVDRVTQKVLWEA